MAEPAADQQPARRRRRVRQQPIYGIIREVVDPATGKRMGALVPASDADRESMRARGFRRNARVRMLLTQPRNELFNRLVHGMGKLIAKNLDAYAGKGAHAAIKQLQLDADAYCEERDINASPLIEAVLSAAETVLGRAAAAMLRAVLPAIKTVRIKEPQSLSYDSMGEEIFQDFWRLLCLYLIEHHWPDLDEKQITEMAEIEANGRHA